MVVTFTVLKITCKSSIKNKKSFWLLLSKKNDIKSQWLQIKCWSNKLMTEDKKVLLIFFPFIALLEVFCIFSSPFHSRKFPSRLALHRYIFSLQWFIDGFFLLCFNFLIYSTITNIPFLQSPHSAFLPY